MTEPLLYFAISAFVLLLLFVTHAFFEKKFSEIPRILWQGTLTGIVVGVLSDLVLGKFFGLWSYAFGFDALPLILTAVFVYGLFAANVLLMQQARSVHFFVWVVVVMAVYEVTNLFFPVWTYEFTLPPFGFLLFLLIGYFATAVFIAAVWHIFFNRPFLFIEELVEK